MEIGNLYLLTTEKLQMIDYYKIASHFTKANPSSASDLYSIEAIENVPMINILKMYIRRLYSNVRCENICLNSDWYCLSPNSFIDVVMLVHHWKLEFSWFPKPAGELWARSYIDQCFVHWSNSTINLNAEEICSYFKIDLISNQLNFRLWKMQSEKVILLDKFICDTLNICKQRKRLKPRTPTENTTITDVEFGYLLMNSNNLKPQLNLYLTIQYIFEKYSTYTHRTIDVLNLDDNFDDYISDTQSFSSNETQYEGSDYE